MFDQSRNELTHWDNRPFYSAWPDSQYKKPTGVTKTLKKKRRTRTAFTTEQLHTLEQSFTYSRYIDPETKKELARNLNLGEKSIKIWFQNRRMKEKRNSSESSSDVSIEESSGKTSLTDFNVSRENSSVESSGITSPTDFNVSRENFSLEISGTTSPINFNDEKKMLKLLQEDIPSIASNHLLLAIILAKRFTVSEAILRQNSLW